MADVVTGEAVALDIRAARLPTRALALAIDMTLQLALLIGLGLLAATAATIMDPALAATIALVLQVAVIVGYPTACETLWHGRSLGKLALGLRVVGEDGGPERFRQALLRALAGIFEIWLLTGLVAIVASLVSERGRRLGDVFAGTLVVQERLPARSGEPATMPPALQGWAASLELVGLPDDLAVTARQYVSRYTELAPDARDQMGQRIATAVAARVSPPPPQGTPPVAYLSAVLAERHRREHERLAAQQAQRQEAAVPPGVTWPAAQPAQSPQPDGAAGAGSDGLAGQRNAPEPPPPNSGGFVPPA